MVWCVYFKCYCAEAEVKMPCHVTASLEGRFLYKYEYCKCLGYFHCAENTTLLVVIIKVGEICLFNIIMP